MIEYEYVITRDEGDRVREYVPNEKIGKKLPNLVLIEAPNSSGKSTLLNIFAVGLFGLKNTEGIVDSLVRDMKSLVKTPSQKIWFKFTITTPDGLVLISEKKEGSEIPYVREKIGEAKPTLISPETFNKKYRLIYDIPDKPRDRLKNILLDIKNLQNTIGKDVESFRKYLTQVLEEIKNSKNPEQIKKLEGRIADYNKRIQEMQYELKWKKNVLEKLSQYAVIKRCYLKILECQNIENTIKNLSSRKRKITKTTNKFTKAYTLFKVTVDELFSLRTKIITEIAKLSRSDFDDLAADLRKYFTKEKLLNFKSAKYKEYLASIYQLLSTLEDITIQYKQECENQLDTEIKELEILEILIKVLDQYKDWNVEIPGTNKKIVEYLKDLKKEYERKRIIGEEYKALKEIFKLVNEIKKTLGTTFAEQLRELKKTYTEGQIVEPFDLTKEEIEDKIKELKNRLSALNKQLEEECVPDCMRWGLFKEGTFNIPLISETLGELENTEYIRKFKTYDEAKLINAIKNANNDIDRLEKTIGRFLLLKEKTEDELKKLKKMPEHKFSRFKKQINELRVICEKLERKFNKEYDAYLEILRKSQKNVKVSNTQEFKLYHEAISRYLAKKLDRIKFVDGTHKVRKVDLLTDTIYTEDNKTIQMSFLGTGHMQAAYLTALLNKDDPRKIIALFDEISDMDRTTLSTIVQKVVELYNQGKLIACIMVQKNDYDVNVIDLKEGLS